MRVEKQKETIDLDKLIDNITLQSPNPSKEHSAENSFSRLMARIQADSNSIDIFRRKASQYRVWLAAATVALLISNEWVAIHDAGYRSFIYCHSKQ